MVLTMNPNERRNKMRLPKTGKELGDVAKEGLKSIANKIPGAPRPTKYLAREPTPAMIRAGKAVTPPITNVEESFEIKMWKAMWDQAQSE